MEKFVDLIVDNAVPISTALEKLVRNHPDYELCRLMSLATMPGISSEDRKNALRLLADGIMRTGKRGDVYALGVYYYVIGASRLGMSADARRMIQIFRQTDRSEVHPGIIGMLAMYECKLYTGLMSYAEISKMLDRVIALKIPPGHRVWFELMRLKSFYSRLTLDVEDTEKTLNELERFRHVLRTTSGFSWEYMKVRALLDFGEIGQAAQYAESIGPAKDLYEDLMIGNLRIKIALKQRDFPEAERLLERARGTLFDHDAKPGEITKAMRASYYYLRAYEALARGDVDESRRRCRVLLEKSDNTEFFERGLQLLAETELAAKNCRGARVILETISTASIPPVYYASWARLHLLEKNVELAVEFFAKIVGRGSGRLASDQLRFAYELDAQATSDLLISCHEKIARTGKDRPAERVIRKKNTPAFIGQSAASARVRDLVAKFAPTGQTILITGETGTGKEVVAKLIHMNGPHPDAPFLAVNCGGIADTLIESELFGHKKGSFTGATRDHDGLFSAAGRGTLFLDEITSMSEKLQAALLRVLENGEIMPVGSTVPIRINARVIAAANEPLDLAVSQGRFRADLFYRLNRLAVAIPPLRERRADVPDLVAHILKDVYGDEDFSVAPSVLQALTHEDWPGNVRELANRLERMVLLSGGSRTLAAEDTPDPSGETGAEHAAFTRGQPGKKKRGRPKAALERKILALFAENPKVTRKLVVGKLGCSGSSATQYLKTLEDAGAIRRVETSRHLKTSYFEKTRSRI